MKLGIASANAKDVPWLVLDRPDRDEASRNKVFIKKIMDPAPRVFHVWYEPAHVYPRHRHPVDEVFYILRGEMAINGHELREGSLLFVPKNTMYGPEYAGGEGVLFLRVELWDTETGPPGREQPGGKSFLRPWPGRVRADGLPSVPGPRAAPTPPGQRSAETVPGSRSVSVNGRQWMETVRPAPGGTSAGQLFSRALMGPAPSVVQVLHAPGFVQPQHQHTVDEIFAMLDGELQVNEHHLTPGSVYFVPKGHPYGPENTSPKGALYLRIVLQDTQAPREQVSMKYPPRPWQGPLTPDGLPDVRVI